LYVVKFGHIAMTQNDDYYRREAAEAQRQAGGATTDADRAAWLQIAQGWLSMVRTSAEAAEFTRRLQAEGTGQDISSQEQ
jgi:hypothetical protein